MVGRETHGMPDWPLSGRGVAGFHGEVARSVGSCSIRGFVSGNSGGEGDPRRR